MNTLPIEHLSYSSMSLYANNEYAWFLKYIESRYDLFLGTPSMLVGSAFHKYAEMMFKGVAHDIAMADAIQIIDERPASKIDWGKTGSREKCKTELANLVKFFTNELPSVGNVIGAEVENTANFDTGDGVMSPVPIKAISDLITEIDGELYGWDWKTTRSLTNTKPELQTSDDHVSLAKYNLQAAANYFAMLAKYGRPMRGYYFFEIKPSVNRNGGKQTNLIYIDFEKTNDWKQVFLNLYDTIIIDLSNPNKVFKPNFMDRMLGGKVWEEYRKDSLDDLVMPQIVNKSPLMQVQAKQFEPSIANTAVMEAKEPHEKIIVKLQDFGQNLQYVDQFKGSSATLYRFLPGVGVKMASLQKHEPDVMQATGSMSARIISPIPGTQYVGIELSNEKQDFVKLPELENNRSLIMPVGEDVYKNKVSINLESAPHVLVAGATGSGKSIGLEAMITALIQQNSNNSLQLHLVDPKRTEFSHLEGEKCVRGVYSEIGDIHKLLTSMVDLMEQRYIELKRRKVKSIAQTKMSRVVIVVDELADILQNPDNYVEKQELDGKEKSYKRSYAEEIEMMLVRLAQKSRASGIHLILATQRPSVDVIKGSFKANLPTRVCYMVSTSIDSKVVLDQTGAERLLGNGDCLIMKPGERDLIRAQGYYV